ncbi:NAD(+)/NADH kinase [Tengunoibacter tsumagoiensis]|uniref:NAD kinase n=1 Tax=Tengunoibacter tsumagoiensis TaxID=2014871 RepID=A0A402A2Q5_9CHLR|nr:NAD(+)/NADH kinase [Tengunoibacter tsumagoiensis]GCE13339.1 NAD kinase [Tengunoibacter tsumagoiensis]
MKTIAIFYQGRKQEAATMASQLVPTLEHKGHTVRSIDLHEEGQECATSSIEGCDLVLVLGGDGTIVHASRVCACLGVPIVGINFGRVGFLTELEPAELETKLDYYIHEDASVWTDERSMLHAVLTQDGTSEEFLALNDIVIARGTWPRVIQVRVTVDDYYYNTSYADGMILSTATGSTAYNMAVGGPLLHPQVKSSVLTPIAAHLASDRSLVLQPEARVELQIFTGSQNGVFSADGQLNRELKDGAIITVHKSQYETKFLRRRPPTYFYQIINAKLRNDSTPETESHHAN